MERLYFTYQDIHRTIASLASSILGSGFDPDVIVAIGTGGFIPARMLKTHLKKPILTVGIKLYGDDNKPQSAPKKLQWIDEVEGKLRGKKVLLVDEVDDTRTTLSYCLRELLSHRPEELAVAVLHNKLKDKAGLIPEEIERYYAGREIPDLWVAYPWDALDIDEHDRLAAEASRDA
jgi:uncharacterized protein